MQQSVSLFMANMMVQIAIMRVTVFKSYSCFNKHLSGAETGGPVIPFRNVL